MDFYMCFFGTGLCKDEKKQIKIHTTAHRNERSDRGTHCLWPEIFRPQPEAM
jgi:hypothetical protein